jgi:hypothetical protein
MTAAAAVQPSHSDPGDRVHVVTDATGGCCWQICAGGLCLQDRSGARLMERYRALLVSQGRAAPLS